jgi:hypothetical protein
LSSGCTTRSIIRSVDATTTVGDSFHFALTYRSTLLATFLLTVVFDLTVAVEVGLIMACLFFIYRIATLTRLAPLGLEPAAGAAAPTAGVEAWKLTGALFFGSVGKLESLTDPARYAAGDAPRVLILDLADMLALDTTGVETLDALRRLLARRGGALLLSGAREQPLSLLRRSGFVERAGEENVLPDLAEAQRRAIALLGGDGAGMPEGRPATIPARRGVRAEVPRSPAATAATAAQRRIVSGSTRGRRTGTALAPCCRRPRGADPSEPRGQGEAHVLSHRSAWPPAA